MIVTPKWARPISGPAYTLMKTNELFEIYLHTYPVIMLTPGARWFAARRLLEAQQRINESMTRIVAMLPKLTEIIKGG